MVGSSHRGAVGRVVPGSVGESLLSGAPCAVAIAPRGFTAEDLGSRGVIGVGIDHSHESRLALREAVRLAELLGLRLRLITVVPEIAELTMQAPRIEQINASLETEFRQYLDEAEASPARGDRGGDADAEGRRGHGSRRPERGAWTRSCSARAATGRCAPRWPAPSPARWRGRRPARS